ncbi:MAG: nitrogen regulation protein NtrY [Candidatus Rokubacteria bacterium CSP1-6]|nr:MAG: nitrogen regulation protein NtrY [Candidatus Rokubacteria bacterium CSP1-6]
MPLTGDLQRRKRNLLIIGGILVLLVATVATVYEVGIRSPQIPLASNLLVFALFNLTLIVFLLLLVLLIRNLVKLFFERRQQVLGSKFKTKLVAVFLSLSLIPALLISIIASNLLNTSIEGWFKPQVEKPLDQALEVAQTYYQTLETTVLRHGRQLARVIARDRLLADDRREALAAYLVEQQESLGVAAISIFTPRGQELVHVKDPVLASVPTRDVNMEQVKRGLEGQEITTVRELDNGDLIQAVVPIWSGGGTEREVVGTLIVATHVAQRLEARVRGISQAFQEYKQLKLLKNPIKGIYILLFLLMTLIIVFSFTWFGLYMARGITGPIQLLAEGTREVAAGNLNYKVQVQAQDEIGILVDSFNRMTSDLQAKHNELEERRRYTETVIQAVATGVVSLDPAGRLTTMNGAAARMLGIPAETAVGQPFRQLFAGPQFAEVGALIQRMDRVRRGTLEREMRLRRDGHAVTLLGSATALRGPEGDYAGMVLVFDDLTELLKAQRVAAWREVAQRIAHEIKNPLTPIQLSAQRLRRRLGDRGPDDRRLLEECTGTIIQEVEGLKHLVDEFSRFARMPALQPKPTELPRLLEGVVALYRESHPALALKTALAPDLPTLEVDPDQIKRAVLNLVDNAVEAVSGAGEVTVETRFLPETKRVRIVVSDDGVGIPPEDKDKLFLPYFSTKAAGMGLGLAIVHQIVTDHGGSIWVEDNAPKGSRFVIELPVDRPASQGEA